MVTPISAIGPSDGLGVTVAVGVGVGMGGVGVGVGGTVAVGEGVAGGVGVGVVAGGVGVGVVAGGVGVGVVAGSTVVDAVAELLAWKGSIAKDWAEAVLLSGPATVGVTTKITVALLKIGRSPRLQKTELVPLQLP